MIKRPALHLEQAPGIARTPVRFIPERRLALRSHCAGRLARPGPPDKPEVGGVAQIFVAERRDEGSRGLQPTGRPKGKRVAERRLSTTTPPESLRDAAASEFIPWAESPRLPSSHRSAMPILHRCPRALRPSGVNHAPSAASWDGQTRRLCPGLLRRARPLRLVLRRSEAHV